MLNLGCFVLAIATGLAALVAIATRHRHAIPLASGSLAALLTSTVGAIGMQRLVQRDDADVARVFLVLVVNTGSAFFFGVTAMLVAARHGRRS